MTVEIFFEVHQGLPREAPGSDDDTRRAIGLLPAMTNPRILDIGCGPGAQTLVLARQLGGEVTALDTYEPFLDVLRERARESGLSDRITAVNRSMFEMDFEPYSFDLLWSEGAVYIYGLEKALEDWSMLLHKGGCLGVTEAAWLQEDPPSEIAEFWEAAYPEMRHVDDIVTLIPAKGYDLLGHFVLPQTSWWETYYQPMTERIGTLRKKYAGNQEAQGQLDEEQREIDLYRRFHKWYGYVFFVMQKA
ncbi:MAG: class I SAM-dependent methyltransferase [Anaerolineales bacterium]|jgi:ubiquinone/menaquinone biosynthesis C-methylase UbiE